MFERDVETRVRVFCSVVVLLPTRQCMTRRHMFQCCSSSAFPRLRESDRAVGPCRGHGSLRVSSYLEVQTEAFCRIPPGSKIWVSRVVWCIGSPLGQPTVIGFFAPIEFIHHPVPGNFTTGGGGSAIFVAAIERGLGDETGPSGKERGQKRQMWLAQ